MLFSLWSKIKVNEWEKMIAIIDYKAGNLKSVERALKKLGFACRITHDREEVLNSERIIFPGVGAAGKAIADKALLSSGFASVHRSYWKKAKRIILSVLDWLGEMLNFFPHLFSPLIMNV
jgi:imidazoleglycerol phosphate synthase glutamine amidotransferase subunit HisH